MADQGLWIKRYWSGYKEDPWKPDNLAKRLIDGRLRVGISEVDSEDIAAGDKVGIWLFGPGVTNGFYARGVIDEIDSDSAWLTELDVNIEPLTMPARAVEAASDRSSRSRLFYLAPAHAPDSPPVGSIDAQIPGVDLRVAAYWVRPRRAKVQWGTELDSAAARWRAFKYGDQGEAEFLALGMYAQIVRLLPEVAESGVRVVVVPVPLDPRKAADGGFHRTLALAKGLSRIAKSMNRKAVWEVREELTLTSGFSKRELANEGRTRPEVERLLSEVSDVAGLPASGKVTHLLLVDDVVTHGTTMKVHARTLAERYPAARIVAVSAAQMATKELLGDRPPSVVSVSSPVEQVALAETVSPSLPPEVRSPGRRVGEAPTTPARTIVWQYSEEWQRQMGIFSNG